MKNKTGKELAEQLIGTTIIYGILLMVVIG